MSKDNGTFCPKKNHSLKAHALLLGETKSYVGGLNLVYAGYGVHFIRGTDLHIWNSLHWSSMLYVLVPFPLLCNRNLSLIFNLQL